MFIGLAFPVNKVHSQYLLLSFLRIQCTLFHFHSRTCIPPLPLQSQLFEVVEEVYKLVIPVYQHRRQYHSLESTYTKVANCYKNMALKGERRFLGSYFRVGFYGNIFGDLHLKEYIYKEEALARLGEFALKLEVSSSLCMYMYRLTHGFYIHVYIGVYTVHVHVV